MLSSMTSPARSGSNHQREPRAFSPVLSSSIATPNVEHGSFYSHTLHRPRIERPTGNPEAMASGYIEFESLDRGQCGRCSKTAAATRADDPSTAERAFATVSGQFLRDYGCTLDLRPSETLPEPSAIPRMFKSSPLTVTAGQIFDLCRPFGPVHRVALGGNVDGVTMPKGQAVVTFMVSSAEIVGDDAGKLTRARICRMRPMRSARHQNFIAPFSRATPSWFKISNPSACAHLRRLPQNHQATLRLPRCCQRLPSGLLLHPHRPSPRSRVARA